MYDSLRCDTVLDDIGYNVRNSTVRYNEILLYSIVNAANLDNLTNRLQPVRLQDFIDFSVLVLCLAAD